MLIKVSTKSRTWILFDNCSDVEYDFRPTRISAKTHLPQSDESGETKIILIGFSRQDIENDSVTAGKINFFRDGVRHVVLFDTYAYICNDSGRTLDKVAVNGDYHP